MKNIMIEEGKVYTQEQADIIFASIEASWEEKSNIEDDTKNLYKIEKKTKKLYKENKNSESHKEAEQQLYEKKLDFLKKYGSENLCIFNMHKTLSAKLQNLCGKKSTKIYKNNKAENFR